MQITKKSLFMLVALLGVAAAVAAYMVVFSPNQDKIAALEAENSTLESRVAELEGYQSQLSEFQQKTEENKTNVNKILAKLPAAYKYEDVIMYSIDQENTSDDTFISAIVMDSPENEYKTQPSTVVLSEEQTEGEKVYTLKSRQVTYATEFTYVGMKKFVNSIVRDDNRKSLEQISLSFDNTTGILSGSVIEKLYTITGSDKEYEPYEIPEMKIGVDNIFGTVKNGSKETFELEEETAE